MQGPVTRVFLLLQIVMRQKGIYRLSVSRDSDGGKATTGPAARCQGR